MVRKYVLPLAAVAALGFAVFHVVRAQQAPPKLPPPVAPARAPFGSGVAGAGLVEARTENIAIGSHLAGVVEAVHVKVGEKVKRGQELFRLDDRQLRAELRVRQANLASARAQRDKLKAMPRLEELPPLEARVREAEANLTNMQDLARRSRRLYAHASRAVAEEEVVQREQAARMAREQLEKARADLALARAGAWRPDLAVSEAAVEEAEGRVQQTKVELDRLVVRSPIDGEVMQVNVRPGEFVGTPPGQGLVMLGNLEQLHVRVDIDEHDIPRFRTGKLARAMLRGAPRQEFALRFVRVEPFVVPKKSLTGDNAERVDTRVLQVIFALPAGERRIYVGQQVDVYVEGAERQP